MPYGALTVAELQAILDNIPGDAIVLLSARNAGMSTTTIRTASRKEREVLVWGNSYDTRVILNAYGCNDDRFDQNRTVLIEIGEDEV